MAAQHFIETSLGSAPFLAVHWRRGDRAHPEMGTEGRVQYEAVSPPRVAEAARRLLARHGHVKHVVLLSNCGSSRDLNELQRLLPFVRVSAAALDAIGLGGGASCHSYVALVRRCR